MPVVGKTERGHLYHSRKYGNTVEVIEPPPSLPTSEPGPSGGIGKGSGGNGGTVFLIAGTLFIGYLYISRRLDGVIAAIKNPPNISGLPGGGPPINPANPNSGGFGTVPTAVPNPSTGNQYGNRNFTLYFPPQYHASPVQIMCADSQSCKALIYNATYQATGSIALAETYAALYG